jgi:hypothetical protein
MPLRSVRDMKDIPDNYVYSFAVVEESDNTKKNEPLNLLEFYFTNQDGSSFETRMDMSASIALIGQVTKIASDIINRYPISDTDKELEIPDNVIQLLKNHD